MIRKVEKYRVEYGTIPTKQEIEDLIIWCRDCKLNQVIIELEYGFEVRYYSGKCIDKGVTTRTVSIDNNCNAQDILDNITKFKEECDLINSQPIPV